jgi:hypothetical protein
MIVERALKQPILLPRVENLGGGTVFTVADEPMFFYMKIIKLSMDSNHNAVRLGDGSLVCIPKHRVVEVIYGKYKEDNSLLCDKVLK